MARSSSASSLLNLRLPHWRELLRGWALDGSIFRAAAQALGLDGEPPLLQELVSQWAASEFSGLPPVELLPAAFMAGAAGAYALSPGTIYLNADWLPNASAAQVLAVLTEELGHHLDGLLNSDDSPGDEGAIFSALLAGGSLTDEVLAQLKAEDDQRIIVIDGQSVAVEMANFTGTEGDDVIIGTSEDDFIDGLGGNDSVSGGNGNDVVYGQDGNDTIDGGAGNDTIDGGAGNDTIDGGTGNDTISQGSGVNLDNGGDGSDTLVDGNFSSLTNNQSFSDSGTTYPAITLPDGTTIRNIEYFTNLTTGSGNDIISYNLRLNNNFNTGGGDDIINSGL